jgi:hypothetical protein
VADIQHSKHSGRYTAADTLADTKWCMYRGKYTVMDIQRQIQQWIYNTADTVADTEWQINSSRSTPVDTPSQMHSSGYQCQIRSRG